MSVAQVLRSANGHQEFFPSADADYVRVLASHSRLDVHSLVLHGEGDSIANQTLKLLNERRCTPCGHWNGLAILTCRSWDAIICATLAHART